MDTTVGSDPAVPEQTLDLAPAELVESIRRGLADVAAGRVVEGHVVVAALRRQASEVTAKLARNGDARGAR